MEGEKRPWGSYRVLLDEEYCKVKKISILPGQSISYQYHKKRLEDWIIVQGSGKVRLDSDEFSVGPGDKIHIPKLLMHSIQNTEKQMPLVFIEVQTGDYFGEDDIVRIEDMYGRS